MFFSFKYINEQLETERLRSLIKSAGLFAGSRNTTGPKNDQRSSVKINSPSSSNSNNSSNSHNRNPQQLATKNMASKKVDSTGTIVTGTSSTVEGNSGHRSSHSAPVAIVDSVNDENEFGVDIQAMQRFVDPPVSAFPMLSPSSDRSILDSPSDRITHSNRTSMLGDNVGVGFGLTR